MNNIAKVQNLQRCESLRRLDLTLNFVDRAGLLSLASMCENEFLEDLHLVGNPCTRWAGYRPYVVGLLPQLRRLVGGGGGHGVRCRDSGGAGWPQAWACSWRAARVCNAWCLEQCTAAV